MIEGIMNIARVMRNLFDMPVHKIHYVIRLKDYNEGIWETLRRYNIPHTKENHELLVEIVQTLLVGPDLECEWTEAEYENFVQYKGE
jgi:hypothetical protein